MLRVVHLWCIERCSTLGYYVIDLLSRVKAMTHLLLVLKHRLIFDMCRLFRSTFVKLCILRCSVLHYFDLLLLLRLVNVRHKSLRV